MNEQPIGIFDSGVGGLSVRQAVREILPGESIVYLADQAHVPYGVRPRQQIQDFSIAISEFLLQLDAKLIIVACNTASAAALHALRQLHPEVAFVGMEPAVKPAAATSQTRTVGVLATTATFQGELFNTVVERFAEGVVVLEETLPGLVELIEEGVVDGAAVETTLKRGLQPLLDQGADTLVLGCTHYAFVLPAIRRLVPPSVSVIDPAPAIARQAKRLLDQHSRKSSSDHTPSHGYYTTGEPIALQKFLEDALGESIQCQTALWKTGRLKI